GSGLVKAYYIYSDQLDTPRQITDTAGNTVWQWDNSDPFGNNSPNENPSGQGTLTNNLRFPGQYADKETNTYYNVNRDYDPSIGRYVESDPIGLGGGINSYTYVGGNPLTYIDPFGLEQYLDGFIGPLPKSGYRTSEMTLTRCGRIPPAPPGVSVGMNMWLAKQNWNPYWFNDQVKNKAPWDFKQQGGKYQDFGNFNYGATGAAFGFPDQILYRAAGYANQKADDTRTGLGSPLGVYPYGDDFTDQLQIKKGVKYCECMQH
ncbi:MAG: RHS repeat-associated core domain-containing protein, partial [Fimbriimonadaceae bacterium]